MKKVAIIGGGLSGLITSIQLTRVGIPVQLFERKSYPFHRVCGEYISNETLPFLKAEKLFPEVFAPPAINRLEITSTNGRRTSIDLDLGGFGISRYNYDNWLFEIARGEGVEFHLNTEVNAVSFHKDRFQVSTTKVDQECDVVIGAFGKRSRIDRQMHRSFMKKSSPYVGVKYHIKTSHPQNLISLHNFENGYCGISQVEGGVANLCYLTHRNNLKQFGSIKQMEKNILFQNPFIKSLFSNSTFLFDSPETINEISFETKRPVEDHVLMTGDAAGMITPLCGNGMAMAIHSAKILSQLLIPYCNAEMPDREVLEKAYAKSWQKLFAKRLWIGRQVQKLFGAEWTSNLAVSLGNNTPAVAKYLISKTHGRPF